ncbi:MAG: hypothetical protein CM1200mP12_07980 [Gammaproteobacteria bacterium]|nr:MAG: hypothetical protein CM1200mP12_07980 [Gammaproteobacteria bacterium]
MASDQPDKRKRSNLPLDTFGDFQYRQALAEEMLPMIGRLYRKQCSSYALRETSS